MRPVRPVIWTMSLHATCSNPEYNVRVETGMQRSASGSQEIQKGGIQMGDKSKKDKEKGQKQNAVKQKEKMDKKIEKQPKKAS